MNKIFDYIKQADKRKLFIYLFSFSIFIVLNNILVNIINYPLRGEIFFNKWVQHIMPCEKNERLFYMFAFLGLKTLTFIGFLFYAKRHPNAYLAEIFVAYFFYDFVYILSAIWDIFSFLNIYALQMFYSSPQVLFNMYLKYSTLFISILWTFVLFTFLYKQKHLTIKFLFNRLTVIPISVFLTTWLYYFIYHLVRY